MATNPRSRLPRTWRVRIEGIGPAEERRRRLLELVRTVLGDGVGDGEEGGGSGCAGRGAPGRDPSGDGDRPRSAGPGSPGGDGTIGEGAAHRP